LSKQILNKFGLAISHDLPYPLGVKKDKPEKESQPPNEA